MLKQTRNIRSAIVIGDGSEAFLIMLNVSLALIARSISTLKSQKES